jgi:hypothetical protein
VSLLEDEDEHDGPIEAGAHLLLGSQQMLAAGKSRRLSLLVAS